MGGPTGSAHAAAQSPLMLLQRLPHALQPGVLALGHVCVPAQPVLTALASSSSLCMCTQEGLPTCPPCAGAAGGPRARAEKAPDGPCSQHSEVLMRREDEHVDRCPKSFAGVVRALGRTHRENCGHRVGAGQSLQAGNRDGPVVPGKASMESHLRGQVPKDPACWIPKRCLPGGWTGWQ